LHCIVPVLVDLDDTYLITIYLIGNGQFLVNLHKVSIGLSGGIFVTLLKALAAASDLLELPLYRQAARYRLNGDSSCEDTA